MGLPDFSIIPKYIFQQHSVSALKKANVKSYNDKLKTFVKENQSAGHNILFYDFNRFLEELIHDKAKLSQEKIIDVIHSCLYRNQEPVQYWKSIAFNHHNSLFMYAVIPVFRDALSDPNYYKKGGLKKFVDKECGNNYIFWDTVHPTKKGHLVIAQHLLTYIHNHFNLSRAKSDVGYCYNLQVINKGWFILDVSQKNNICGPENTYLLKNNEKLVSVEFNKPVKFKAILGKSITFSHLPHPIQGLGAKIECTGTNYYRLLL